MTIGEFMEILDSAYPKYLSCAWDNDGIMVCTDKNRIIKKAVLALDATIESISFAVNERADLLLTHHPLIFRPMNSFDTDLLTPMRIMKALSSDLSVISLHTRLDAGNGGVNDCLAERLHLTVTEKFGDSESPELARIAVTDMPLRLDDFIRHVKECLLAPCVKVTGYNPERTVNKVALCGGSGKSLLKSPRLADCDVFVTGELGYNDATDAADLGITMIEAGHYYTEAPVLKRFTEIIKNNAPDVDIKTYNSYKSLLF